MHYVMLNNLFNFTVTNIRKIIFINVINFIKIKGLYDLKIG